MLEKLNLGSQMMTTDAAREWGDCADALTAPAMLASGARLTPDH